MSDHLEEKNRRRRRRRRNRRTPSQMRTKDMIMSLLTQVFLMIRYMYVQSVDMWLEKLVKLIAVERSSVMVVSRNSGSTPMNSNVLTVVRSLMEVFQRY